VLLTQVYKTCTVYIYSSNRLPINTNDGATFPDRITQGYVLCWIDTEYQPMTMILGCYVVKRESALDITTNGISVQSAKCIGSQSHELNSSMNVGDGIATSKPTLTLSCLT